MGGGGSPEADGAARLQISLIYRFKPGGRQAWRSSALSLGVYLRSRLNHRAPCESDEPPSAWRERAVAQQHAKTIRNSGMDYGTPPQPRRVRWRFLWPNDGGDGSARSSSFREQKDRSPATFRVLCLYLWPLTRMDLWAGPACKCPVPQGDSQLFSAADPNKGRFFCTPI